VLPVIEIKTEEPFYTFRAHYDPGAAEMEVASLEPDVQAAVEEAARRAYTAAGCRDFARVDIILDRDSAPQILEINTIPGLTETGPARFAAEAAGLDFAGLVQRVVDRAAAEAGAAG
jgi:D-alanine-D-alanine ligase